MIKKFTLYYKPHRKLLAFDLTCAFFLAALSISSPIAVNLIMESLRGNPAALLICGGVLLSVFALMAGISFLLSYYGHILGVRIQGDMRSDLFCHLETLPFSYFDENKTGWLMSRIVNDLFEIGEISHHVPEETFVSVITICGAFAVMFVYNWILALCLLAVLPFMITFAIVRRKKRREAFKKAREKVAIINAEIESSISGIRVSKAYTASGLEVEKFETANVEFKKARIDAFRNMAIFHSGMLFFNRLLYFVSIVGGGLLLYFQVFKDPAYAMFLMFMGVLIGAIQTLVGLVEQVQDGMTGFARFVEILAVPPESEPENPVEIGKLRGDISFDNVSFSYKSKDNPGSTKVIKELTLSIEAGRTIALVGPSGGGKTTLCHLIPRFYEIDGGAITVDGVDIRQMRREDLRKNIGIVAQEVFLFAGSIRDNIAYGSAGASDGEIHEAAARANIHEFALSLPSGYDTQVGERGVKLSGGQKQRISIARAFLKNPPILILDEATSSLDNITEMQIQSALEELSRGRTTIIVAHRLSTVKHSDEILVLTTNGISERGNHRQLMELGGFYADLYSFYS
ncbi:MAG: ABC transporter ATP-binding protein/permease [Firmicutes bacterium]|nr:ABC transporter ATP-binding protein/permease [Bacillota bacterium]